MPPPRRPFRAAEALAAGALTRSRLHRDYFRMYPGVWAPHEADLTACDRARAALLWSRRNGVLAGPSASAMLGAKWIDGDTPAELVHTNRRPPPLLTVHTDTLLPGEVRTVGGMPVTTAARTAFDLGRRLGPTEAVQRIDALMNVTDLKVVDVMAVADAHPGARDLRQLDETLLLVDGGAESPYESLARLLLVRAGFPGRRPRSGCTAITALSLRASTSDGRSTSSALTSKAPTIGPTRCSASTTPSATTCCLNSAGSTCG